MARIPEAQIEQLKSQISLERLAEARGVRLKRHGKDLIGRCPFHDDREPSLVITPSSNLWHCLGECQAGGTVIDWVMKAEGVSFRHAVELLRERHLPSLDAEEPPKIVKASTVKKLPVVLERSVDDDKLFVQVVNYYHETLKQSPEALEYLSKRGLGHPEVIDHFQLGYANRTLGYRLPEKNRREGAELRGRLQALGVLRESGHEHLSGSLVIPIFDEQGRVTELYGRKVGERFRAGTPLHLYLPGPHRGVWNLAALEASREIVLCESLIDALTFWCAGIRNATAAYGVEGFTDDHWEAFRRFRTERVLIAYDRDGAGDRAAEKLAGELTEAGIEAWRVVFPRSMDANAYALKVQPAAQSLALALRHATWMGKGSAPATGPRLAASSPTGGVAGAAKERKEPADEGRAEIDDAGVSAEVVADGGETGPAVTAGDEPTRTQQEPEPTSAMPNDAASVPNDPPSGPTPSLAAEHSRASEQSPSGDEVTLTAGDRQWRIRGLSKNPTAGVLRVNVLVRRETAGFHVDTLELYSARQRTAYVKQAADELGVEERVIKRDLGAVLLELERLQEEQIRAASAPAHRAVELTEADRAAALELLRDPRLMDRILEHFEKCGVVGEHTNKLVGYLAATSRKLEQPLAVVIQSSSAAGKSSLMEAILSLMPEEERVSYSAMTGQSLFYMGETNLQHKILAIVEEEGAERAAYALKLLQSEGELTIASTGKDPTTGRLVTHEYRVEGPVMIFLTTTAIEIDEELLNRCLVLSVDERREQTRAIHERQRRAQTLEGLLAREEQQRVLVLHQNAQRLLRPLVVVNPFAQELSFLDHQTRARRDFPKYLTLIRTIALLHQHQRPVKATTHRGRAIRYLEVTKEDIALANRLASEVMGRTLDELSPGTRRLLGLLDEMVRAESERRSIAREDFRFSRREVRERTGWGLTQLRLHLGRLVEHEYVIVHRGARGQSYAYELVYAGEGQNGGAFLPGLLDVESRDGDAATAQSWRGREAELAGGWRGQNGGMAGPWRGEETAAAPQQTGPNGAHSPTLDEKAPLRVPERVVPYRNGAAAAVAAGRG